MASKYILYGAGWEAERLLYRERNLIDEISFCIDANRQGKFHGVPIYRLGEVRNKIQKYFIIVSATWNTFQIIRDQLRKLGLLEFEDFIWGNCFRKKIVVFNANCYKDMLIKILMYSDDFVKNCCVYPTPRIHLNSQRELDELLIKHCDYYIHQDIRADNQYGIKLSDNYILPRLKKSCINITIPNLVGMGKWLFPQAKEYITKKTKHGVLHFGFRDSILDEALRVGFASKEQIISFFLSYKPDDVKIKEIFNHNVDTLEKREQFWDIKISDYIFKILRVHPTFLEPSHVSSYVMLEIGMRLASFMGFADIDAKDAKRALFYSAPGHPMPILPYIKKHYEMCDVDERYFCTLDDAWSISLDEYFDNYFWIHHDIDITKDPIPAKYVSHNFVLFGTGEEAEKVIYRNKWLKDRTEYVIDDHQEKHFHGIPVRKMSDIFSENITQNFYIIATDWGNFLEWKKILENLGLKEFADFIWGRAFNRKIIVMQTDYLGETIRKYLDGNDDFRRNYCIHPLYGGGYSCNKELLMNCDIYIYQPSSLKNNLDVRSELGIRENCKILMLPDFKGLGSWLFPEIMELDVRHNVGGSVEVQYRSLVMEQAVGHGCSTLSQFLDFFNMYTCDEGRLKQEYERMVSVLKKIETCSDVKVSKYIAQNYRNIPMFIDPDHPTVYLMREVGRQVARWLGLAGEVRDMGYERRLRIGVPQPVLPRVAKFWNLEYKVPHEKMRNALCEVSFSTLEEYVDSYLWWFHGKLFGEPIQNDA